ncbi:MAG: D-2-hydroxyacid dehydrogenase [Bryobacteraceae bacterium]|nr:D-2-hydroxyacid dehydrogenase [Bryobacteraceae bacterium]
MMRNTLLALLLATGTLSGQTKKIMVMEGQILNELGSIPGANLVLATDRATAMREIVDADAVIGAPSAELLQLGKNVKWLQVMSAGVEPVLHLSGSNYLRDSDIVLTNNQIVQGPEIADHALALLLTLSRGLLKFERMRTEENWQPRPYPGIELRGKTAVVVGVGGIGSQIALRAWAFGMNVIGVDPEDIPFSPFITRVVKPDQIDSVMPLADVLFISAPHTPQSHKMIGPKQFELMKQNSYFIAVSRGGTYDLNSLIKALDSRRLAGAGVDVMDPEPLPKGNALWKFDNVVITPHIAGRSDMDRGRMVGTIGANIRRFIAGQPLLNVVDKKKGY